MSNPMSATARRRFTAPSKPPSLRGNSSYQAPNRARGRSTHSGTGGASVRSASGTPATSRATWSSRPELRRTCTLHEALRRPAAASSTRRWWRDATPAARPSRMRAPSSSSISTSSPAAALISMSWRQVANRSRQASTTISWRPIWVGEMTVSQRSLPRSTMGAVFQRPLPFWPTRRQRTRAASRSWPLRKTSAETVTRSPTIALVGNSRDGVAGLIASIVMGPSTHPA